MAFLKLKPMLLLPTSLLIDYTIQQQRPSNAHRPKAVPATNHARRKKSSNHHCVVSYDITILVHVVKTQLIFARDKSLR